MDINGALKELEDLADSLSVKVVYDHFTGEGMGPGGLCKLRGSWRVIVERRASPSEKVSILASALSRFDLEDRAVSSGVLKLVERHRE